MPEIETYSFSHKELLELLIKASNVHDGEWQLLVHFTFTAGNFGPNEEGMLPGAIAAVSQIGITRAKPESPKGLVSDAAKVNPRRST
ncbi:MAG: hypothetical protein E5X07_22660 [Mesorhizobium sp.]|uniref:hypothetical protein n=1 Tax=Mesorhizobium sp. TaxID=1871066 RepID=UPI001224885F|nr:hypothetical protein [Mesorhizobium sp.]TIR28285.1 MAG: hypothetical protein E5X35_31360 [Mesorhizobium sp.]TIS21338.1 MAG: hypothetical protein E5X07_22660 [Mesorhizobium sp.]